MLCTYEYSVGREIFGKSYGICIKSLEALLRGEQGEERWHTTLFLSADLKETCATENHVS